MFYLIVTAKEEKYKSSSVHFGSLGQLYIRFCGVYMRIFIFP